MRLSELEGEKALEVLADLLDPAAEIFQDEDVAKALRGDGSRLEKIKVVLKKQPKAVIKLMAILDGEDPETYKVNVLTLPVKLVQLLNDPMLVDLFQSQGQPTGNASSGSAQENTGAQ